MNVEEYLYFSSYLKNLEEYHKDNYKKMSVRNRIGICKEIENVKKLFENDNTRVCKTVS